MIARRTRGALPPGPGPGAAGAESHGCRRCGSPYRPPRWGREYLCGACGSPLERRQRRFKFSLPVPVLCGGLLFGLAAAVVRVGADNATTLAARRASSNEVPRSTRLPPNFRERLLERLRSVQADLRAAPDAPLVLEEAARVYLYLLVLDRDEPIPARHWNTQAGRTLERLRRLAPERAVPLQVDLAEADRLTWSDGSGRSSLVVLRHRAQSASASPGGLALRPRFRRRAPANGPGEPTFSRYVRAVSGPSTPPAGMGPQPPEPADDERLAELRRALAAAPDDPIAANELGKALELRARQENVRPGLSYGEICPQSRAFYRQAIATYQQAARNAPLRIHRAAFHKAAAETCKKVHESEGEYHELAEAVRWAPYATGLWRDLQVAALRTGRTRESRAARQRITEWSLPVLQNRS